MGATATVLAGLKEDLDEQYLKEKMGDQYDPVEFTALKNENRILSKDCLFTKEGGKVKSWNCLKNIATEKEK